MRIAAVPGASRVSGKRAVSGRIYINVGSKRIVSALGYNEDLVDLQEYIEEVDEDLEAVEDFLDEECEGDCDDCDDYDCECNSCYDDEEDDGEYFEVECPSCGDKVCFDESIDPEELVCPACGEKFSCIFEEGDEDEE